MDADELSRAIKWIGVGPRPALSDIEPELKADLLISNTTDPDELLIRCSSWILVSLYRRRIRMHTSQIAAAKKRAPKPISTASKSGY